MADFNRAGSLRYIFTSSLLIFFSLPAFVSASPMWQGPYIGAYLGGGFGSNQVSTNVGGVTNTSYFLTPANISSVNNAGTISNNPNAVIGGIQFGHDWVWEKFVYGALFDYGFMPFNSSQTVSKNYPDNSGQYSLYTSMSTNWLFTLRGRLGYQTVLYWPALFYATGGMAITQLKITNNFNDNSSFAGAGGSHLSENEIGWAGGVGFELATFEHASLAFEYLYVHVPSVTTTSTITNTQGGFGIPIQSLSNPFSTSGQFHANLLKLELSYRFDE